jgi:hypothetical protein
MNRKTASRSFTVLLGILVLFLAARSLRADNEEKQAKAKEHFFKAKALVEEGALKKAIVEFKASYDLNPLPIVLFNIAVCYDKVTEYADAMKYYKKFIAEGKEAPGEMIEEAIARIGDLEKYLGFVKLKASEEGAEVLVDGKSVGKTPPEGVFLFFLETGEHTIVLQKAGFYDAQKSFSVVSGETTELELTMTKQTTEASSGEGSVKTAEKTGPEAGKMQEKEGEGRTPKDQGKGKKLGRGPFMAALGMTAAFGLTSIVTGSLALVKDDEVAGMSPDEDWESLREESDRLALATDVMIGLTCASAVSMIVLAFFTNFKNKKDKGSATAGLALSGSSMALTFQGNF